MQLHKYFYKKYLNFHHLKLHIKNICNFTNISTRNICNFTNITILSQIIQNDRNFPSFLFKFSIRIWCKVWTPSSHDSTKIYRNKCKVRLVHVSINWILFWWISKSKQLGSVLIQLTALFLSNVLQRPKHSEIFSQKRKKQMFYNTFPFLTLIIKEKISS